MNHYLIRLKNILRSRYLFKILFIICLIYIFIYIKYDSIPNLEGNIFYGKIIDYKYTNDTYKKIYDEIKGRPRYILCERNN